MYYDIATVIINTASWFIEKRIRLILYADKVVSSVLHR